MSGFVTKKYITKKYITTNAESIDFYKITVAQQTSKQTIVVYLGNTSCKHKSYHQMTKPRAAPKQQQKKQMSSKSGKGQPASAQPTTSKKSQSGNKEGARNAQKWRASNASSDQSSDEEPKETGKRKKVGKEVTIEIDEETEPEVEDVEIRVDDAGNGDNEEGGPGEKVSDQI